jgi:hypothetical protein
MSLGATPVDTDSFRVDLRFSRLIARGRPAAA